MIDESAVMKINTRILELYGEHCKVLRLDPTVNPIQLFKNYENPEAFRWLTILDNNEFAALDIRLREIGMGKICYIPVLIYSDDTDIHREFLHYEDESMI